MRFLHDPVHVPGLHSACLIKIDPTMNAGQGRKAKINSKWDGTNTVYTAVWVKWVIGKCQITKRSALHLCLSISVEHYSSVHSFSSPATAAPLSLTRSNDRPTNPIQSQQHFTKQSPLHTIQGTPSETRGCCLFLDSSHS